MRIIYILLVVLLCGCSSQSSVSNKQGEAALKQILDNIEYVIVEEDDFVNDDNLGTIQIVILSSIDNYISDDGQVAYVVGDNIESLDVDVLLLKYVNYLTSLSK